MTELITVTNNYRKGSDLIAYDEGDEEKIRDLLLGHKVERIADDHMQLDDDTVIRIVPNNGGCSCGGGDYVLDDLNRCDNVITHVEFETGSADITDQFSDTVYRVFVVAEDKRINLYAVSGEDGSGYYGTGYELLVRFPNGKANT